MITRFQQLRVDSYVSRPAVVIVDGEHNVGVALAPIIEVHSVLIPAMT
jgi:hypothetical protein